MVKGHFRCYWNVEVDWLQYSFHLSVWWQICSVTFRPFDPTIQVFLGSAWSRISNNPIWKVLEHQTGVWLCRRVEVVVISRYVKAFHYATFAFWTLRIHHRSHAFKIISANINALFSFLYLMRSFQKAYCNLGMMHWFTYLIQVRLTLAFFQSIRSFAYVLIWFVFQSTNFIRMRTNIRQFAWLYSLCSFVDIEIARSCRSTSFNCSIFIQLTRTITWFMPHVLTIEAVVQANLVAMVHCVTDAVVLYQEIGFSFRGATEWANVWISFIPFTLVWTCFFV